MRPIHVPRISANEDVVRVAAVEKGPNERCEAGEAICVLESTKATFVLEAEEAGYVLLTVERGERVSFGQVLGWIDGAPVDAAALPASPPGNGGGAVAPEAARPAAEAGPVVTRRAEALLDEHGLSAGEVKAAGVLRASDVEAFLAVRALSERPERPEREKSEEAPGWPDLERVMKSLDPGGAGAAEVESLKRALSWAVETYGRRWDRRIPFPDVLFDRWAAAERMGFGEGSNISHLSYVFGDVRVGRNTFVGPFTVLDGSGGLTIGDHCSIAAGVHVYSHDTLARSLSGGRSPLARAATRVGNRCFVGPHAVIAKGVTVGDGSFVAANTLVTSDVPAGTAVQGNPARVVGRVEVAEDGRVSIVPVGRGREEAREDR